MIQYYFSGNLPHPSVDQHWYVEQRRLMAAGQRDPFQAVGAVTFRPEGYVSLDAGAAGGTLVTGQLTSAGS